MMRAEVVEHRQAWDEPAAVASRILAALLLDAPAEDLRMSRDQGDWMPFDLDRCISWFTGRKVTAEVAHDSGWRVSLVHHKAMSVAIHTSPTGEADPDAAIDQVVAVAQALPAAAYGAIRLESDRSALYRDRSIPPLPHPLNETIDWVQVLPPPVVERVGRDALLSAPAAAVEERPDGWFVLRVYADPSRPDDPDALDRIEAVARHLHAALGS
jgi:hypothetical protein